MTTTDPDLATFDVPDADRAAYDAIPDARVADVHAAYWRDRGQAGTPEEAAQVVHRERLRLVEEGRAARAQVAAMVAAREAYMTCPACGETADGRTARSALCRWCRHEATTQATAARATVEVRAGGTRREAVARFLTDNPGYIETRGL
jgi:hypothetical protein